MEGFLFLTLLPLMLPFLAKE